MKPELALRYLHSYAMKDILTIDMLFSDTIVYHDWHGKREGKRDVLDYIGNMFKKHSMVIFELDILKVAVGQDTIMIEFILIVNKKHTVTIVNIIDYDDYDRIKSIRAYRL